MKCLHFADIHARDKDIDEVSKCLWFIVAQAQAEKPDLVVFAGDFFHSRDVRLDSQAAKLVMHSFAALADMAPVVAVLGTASHDGRAPEILSLVKGKYPIHIATQPEQIILVNDGFFSPSMVEDYGKPDAVITLIPQPTKEFWGKKGSIQQTDAEISQAMGQVFAGFGAMASQYPGACHLLVGHFTIGGAVTSTGQVMIGREIEVSREQIDMANADLVCLGHIHKSQWISPNIYYAGSIYRENWGEQEPKGFFVHGLPDIFSSVPIKSRFIENPTRKLRKIEIDTTNGGEIESLDMAILPGLSQNPIIGASVRVEIKVYQDEAAKIDQEAIRGLLAGASEVDIRIVRVPRETVRSVEITQAQGLPEKVTILAKTRGEEVPAGVLQKAQDMEELPAEKIMERVGGAIW